MTHFDALLEAAYMAGHIAADNGRDPDFETWRATVSGLNIIDDRPAPLTLDTIVVGMFYRVETDDPIFALINGRSVLVVGKGGLFVDVRPPNSYDVWAIDPSKLVRG